MLAESKYHGQRTLDLLGSIVGLAILFPVLCVIALSIKYDDARGPVFYRGVRLGQNGRPFHILKFRTMTPQAERIGLLATPEGDGRVTRVGRWLRKYKFDELPQLVNVLRGDMSLVGPRPEAPFYFQYYTEEERSTVLSVRPGMTDYGSLLFHDEGRLLAGSSDPVKTYIETIRDAKVRAQIRYIAEQSLLVDIQVIFLTVWTIVATRVCQVSGTPALLWRRSSICSIGSWISDTNSKPK